MQKKGFTFVELIVATTILVILTTLGFYSYSQYLLDARDSQRKADIASVGSGLKLYKQQRGFYPLPGSSFSLTNGATTVATQGLMNTSVTLSTLDRIPLDPYARIPYLYSITANNGEFQLAATLENNGRSMALLEGTYKTVAKNILPTIMLAIEGETSVDVTTNSTTFILNGSIHNLPYDLETGLPYSDDSSFGTIMSDPNIFFWQNTDYISCGEIQSAGKSIGNGEYQILNSSGVLTGTSCTF